MLLDFVHDNKYGEQFKRHYPLINFRCGLPVGQEPTNQFCGTEGEHKPVVYIYLVIEHFDCPRNVQLLRVIHRLSRHHENMPPRGFARHPHRIPFKEPVETLRDHGRNSTGSLFCLLWSNKAELTVSFSKLFTSLRSVVEGCRQQTQSLSSLCSGNP